MSKNSENKNTSEKSGHDHHDHDLDLDHSHDHHDHEHSHDHHDHAHEHGHHHHHHVMSAEQIQRLGRSFVLGSVLNLVFVVIEIVLGVMFGSVALVADAVHNLSDVVSLVLSWVGFKLNSSKSTPKMTYGYKKLSLLIAFVNSSVLILSLIYIMYEAYLRFLNPQPVSEYSVMIVAAIGVGINFFSAYLFKDDHHDLNARGAYIHLIQDAAISAGVVVSAFVMKLTGWAIVDPIVAVVIVLLILRSAYKLLKESFLLMIGGVPQDVDIIEVKDFLLHQKGVRDVHDLHIWALSASEVALSAHMRVDKDNYVGDLFLKQISLDLKGKYKIHHSTIQIEFSQKNDAVCDLDKSC